MRLNGLATIVLSVFLSAGATFLISNYQKSKNSEVLQTKSIQLVDALHRVRGTIGMAQVGGREEPQIVLRGEDGRVLVLLNIDKNEAGTLYFNSKDKEGAVGLGYLWGSDTPYPIGAKDPLGSWGLRVLGPEMRTAVIGFSNDGNKLSNP